MSQTSTQHREQKLEDDDDAANKEKSIEKLKELAP